MFIRLSASFHKLVFIKKQFPPLTVTTVIATGDFCYGPRRILAKKVRSVIFFINFKPDKLNDEDTWL